VVTKSNLVLWFCCRLNFGDGNGDSGGKICPVLLLDPKGDVIIEDPENWRRLFLQRDDEN